MKKLPSFPHLTWQATLTHVLLLVVSTLILLQITSFTFYAAFLVPVGVFTVYRLLARSILTKDHVAGVRLMKAGEYSAAVSCFERSCSFFERYPLVDRWRYALVIASSPVTYREMALCNIAACHIQQNNPEDALLACERVLADYPNNSYAREWGEDLRKQGRSGVVA